MKLIFDYDFAWDGGFETNLKLTGQYPEDPIRFLGECSDAIPTADCSNVIFGSIIVTIFADTVSNVNDAVDYIEDNGLVTSSFGTMVICNPIVFKFGVFLYY